MHEILHYDSENIILNLQSSTGIILRETVFEYPRIMKVSYENIENIKNILMVILSYLFIINVIINIIIIILIPFFIL